MWEHATRVCSAIYSVIDNGNKLFTVEIAVTGLYTMIFD